MKNLKIWQISREYAGIAEAGGVKNVVCSLSEQLCRCGHEITLFIPQYGCTSFEKVKDYRKLENIDTVIDVSGVSYAISFCTAYTGGVRIVFIVSHLYEEKKDIYCYTEEEERLDPSHKKGCGHIDAPVLEMILQKGVLEYSVLTGEEPDIIHSHDATAAMVPVLAWEIERYRKTAAHARFFVTIHNGGPAYHHEYPSVEAAASITGLPDTVLSKGLRDRFVEPYILAGFYSVLTTVSPWYADELKDPSNTMTDGLSPLFSRYGFNIIGITNGIDYRRYDPEDTAVSQLPYSFSPEKGILEGKYKARSDFLKNHSHKPESREAEKVFDAVCIKEKTAGIETYGFLSADEDSVFLSYHGRLVHQKGIDILTDAVPIVIEKCPKARFIIMGQGSEELEKKQMRLAEQFPGKVLYLKGYERTLTRLSVAVSDYIVLPSFFEPCGLEDFIASIYGTIPVAHSTGGLRKIDSGRTGFLYEPNTPAELAEAICSSVAYKMENPAGYENMMKEAAVRVHRNYSWEKVVEQEYLPLYEGK